MNLLPTNNASPVYAQLSSRLTPMPDENRNGNWFPPNERWSKGINFAVVICHSSVSAAALTFQSSCWTFWRTWWDFHNETGRLHNFCNRLRVRFNMFFLENFFWKKKLLQREWNKSPNVIESFFTILLNKQVPSIPYCCYLKYHEKRQRISL